MPSSRLHALFSGLSDTLGFSNWPELLIQRTIGRENPIVHYVWKGKWHLYCCPQHGDHGSAKEVLAQHAYDAYFDQICGADGFSYINAGANIGAFDIAVASRGISIPYAVSIELNPWTFSRLAFNLAVNKLDSIHAINAGLAGRHDTIPFSARESSVTDCIYNESSTSGAPVKHVALETLEEILKSTSLTGKHFDLLKLDIEGAEYEVIESLSPELLARFSHIIMELHTPPKGRDPATIYKKFSETGFVTGEKQWKADEPPQLRYWKQSRA